MLILAHKVNFLILLPFFFCVFELFFIVFTNQTTFWEVLFNVFTGGVSTFQSRVFFLVIRGQEGVFSRGEGAFSRGFFFWVFFFRWGFFWKDFFNELHQFYIKNSLVLVWYYTKFSYRGGIFIWYNFLICVWLIAKRLTVNYLQFHM